MHSQKTHKEAGNSSSPSSSSLLQRKCICGNHTIAGEECDECRKTQHSAQAPELEMGRPFGSPLLSHEAPHHSGQPLDAVPHSSKAPRLVRDFSSIRASHSTSRTAQSGLKINLPGDKYEQEADSLADKVMSMPDPGKHIRKKCDECDEPDTGSQPGISQVSKVSPLIQRRISNVQIDDERIRREMERIGIPTGMSPQTLSFIDALGSSGQPLPESLRRFFEPRFGVDLGRVRLHTGGATSQLARVVNAKAFTIGRDIVLGAGESSLDTDEGKKLLAHELVHTIQQDGEPKQPVIDGAETTGADAGGPVTGKDSSSPKPVTEGTESAPQAATEETEPASPGESAPKKAPSSPDEDLEYKAVVKQSKIKAERVKTPVKQPRVKTVETKSAAELKPKEADTKETYGNHLEALGKVQSELKVKDFVESFKEAADRLAKKLPENTEAHGTVQSAVQFTTEKLTAKQALAVQNKTHSDPLRTEVAKKASDYPGAVKAPDAPELKADPRGDIPKIAHPETAAPKPKTDNEISLDEQSRSLDDALRNHNVGGQSINIDEGSLAFPKSGEKSFDEAGEAKRQAQDQIAKAQPRYREAEGGIISNSQGEIRTLVDSGLEGHLEARSDSFKTVLKTQQSHAGAIGGRKRDALVKYAEAYEATKTDVNKKLAELNSIEEKFDTIVNDAQKYFDGHVRQQLEYIYTPGVFDYSDWNSLHKDEIKKEVENLLGRGGDDNSLITYFKARKIVQDQDAEKYFGIARSIFISDVIRGVTNEIAPAVVGVLNAISARIKEGKEEADKAFSDLTPKEQEELKTVKDAVTDQFKTLEESVMDRQREIIGEMARSYNKNVDKLKAKFDEIKKDVLTHWLKKAWNKLKAIVNAIIDFATRIAELLGRVAYLIGDIVSSPRYFFNNLVNGIGQGFSTFVGQIDKFLATAFFDWLRGSSGIPIQIPKNWGPQGIFSLFTQLLGLSTETIWQRMEVVYNKPIANAFRRGEVLLDKGLEIFGIIKNEGLGGLWDHIKDSLGTILDDTLDTIKETVLYAAIKKVIFEIGKLLVPGGGFIAIAEKVIRLLQFIVEARNKILDLIEAFVSSLEQAVKGNIPGIVSLITGALTKFITVALDFLISFFGLGSLKDKVTRFIERMEKPIFRGIDWVLNKLKSLVLRVFGRKGEERQREETPARKQMELEETKVPVSPDKPDKAQTDVVLAKQIVKRALDSHLPSGARQLADVEIVLDGIATEVKPALTELRAEEFMPGKPKKEGAIGFKVIAKLQTGKDSLIDSVRFSHEGKVLDHEERWQLGVKGVKRGLLQLEKRGISEATIKEQFPKWQADFGFTLLDLDVSKTPWVIEGEMSAKKTVTTVLSTQLSEQSIFLTEFKTPSGARVKITNEWSLLVCDGPCREINSYRGHKEKVEGTGLDVHHLLEKRFLDPLNKLRKKRGINDHPTTDKDEINSVVLPGSKKSIEKLVKADPAAKALGESPFFHRWLSSGEQTFSISAELQGRIQGIGTKYTDAVEKGDVTAGEVYEVHKEVYDVLGKPSWIDAIKVYFKGLFG